MRGENCYTALRPGFQGSNKKNLNSPFIHRWWNYYQANPHFKYSCYLNLHRKPSKRCAANLVLTSVRQERSNKSENHPVLTSTQGCPKWRRGFQYWGLYHAPILKNRVNLGSHSWDGVAGKSENNGRLHADPTERICISQVGKLQGKGIISLRNWRWDLDSWPRN